MVKLIVYCLAVVLTASNTFCESDTTSPGIELTASNFDQLIDQNNFLILFYSPQCELSKKFIPNFAEIAQKFNSETSLKLGSVDCDEHKQLCKDKGAENLKIQLYKKEDGEVKLVKFNGVRSTEGLAKFLVNQLGENIIDNIIEMPEKLGAINELTEETFRDHIATGQHFIKFYAPWCGHCQRLAPTWDELASALEYDVTVSVSKIDCTQYRPICQDFEVKGYPTLLWIVDGKKIEKYTGPRSLDDLKSFVEKSVGIQKTVEDVRPTESQNVIQLTESNFNHGIETGVTFVKFFAPWCGHCKRMASTWDELAVKFVGNSNVKIAKVDCTVSDNRNLCTEQEVAGFPTIFIYRRGEKVAEYNGNRSLDDLYEFVQRHTTGHDEL